MLALLALASPSAPVYDRVRASLGPEPSAAKADLAILWALAALARSLNATLVAGDAACLGAQTAALVARFEVTDSLMRAELAALRRDFNETRARLLAGIERSRAAVRLELGQLSAQVIGHIASAVESTKEVHAAYVGTALDIVRDFFAMAAAALETHAVLFFVFFQVILLFGVLFYHKLRRQMGLFLS
jgi:hypothetical protein